MSDEYGQSNELPPFKIIVIGNQGIGKTCLIKRYVDDAFIESHSSTLGVDFKMKNLDMDARAVKLQLWDFAGNDRFANIQKSRFEEAHGIIVVYDMTNKESFEDIGKYWADEVSKHKLKPGVAKMVVANKCDLSDMKTVDNKQGKQLAQDFGARFFESSAKLNTNVSQLFEEVARDVKQVVEKSSVEAPDAWREEQRKVVKKRCLIM